MMRDPHKWGLAVVLGSVLGLLAVVGVSAPASALPGDITTCSSVASALATPPVPTRWDFKANLSCPSGSFNFPANSVVFMNGAVVVGPGIDSGALGFSLGSNSFLRGPGVVRAWTFCVVGGDDVAVEGVHLNQCATGLSLGESYKVKEVMIHDCTPSSFTGTGMILVRGGFIESSIVRACDVGVITGQNNKIWNLVVTRALFTGLIVSGGNAVSRTVISHPRSLATTGLDYRVCGAAGPGGGVGCQDGSNSVSGHTVGNNIVVGAAAVVTQSTDVATKSATNCNGVNADRNATTGLMSIPAGC